MVAIGRALMAAPRLLLLDEVSLGLAPRVIEDIFERLTEVRRDLGTAMLLVEQNARVALNFAEYGYILESGRIAIEGPSESLRNDSTVKESYLGARREGTTVGLRPAQALPPEAPMAVLGQPLERAQTTGLELRVENVTLQFEGLKALDDVSFTIPPGQLAALIGPNGAGKSSMVNCCTGLYRATAGAVAIGGNGRHPDARPQGGAARRQPHVPEPRPLQGHDRAREPDGRPLPARQDRGSSAACSSSRARSGRRRGSASASRRSSTSSTSRAIATPTCPTCPTGSRSGSSSGGRSSRTRSSSSSTSR